LAVAVVLRVEQEDAAQRGGAELDELRQAQKQAKAAETEQKAKRADAPAQNASDKAEPALAPPRTSPQSKAEALAAREAPAMRDRSASQPSRKESAKPQAIEPQQPGTASGKSETVPPQERYESTTAARSRQEAESPAPAPASPPAADADERALAKQSARATAGQDTAHAQPQIDAVQSLYREGRMPEADQALRDLCQRFPALALPEELRKQAARLELACAKTLAR
jgi:hypothetical protein